MVAIILFGLVLAGLLFVVLARWGGQPAEARARWGRGRKLKPRMNPMEFHVFIADLLGALDIRMAPAPTRLIP